MVTLLSLAVRLLPPARRDWGRAMLADLSAVPSRSERRSFVLGCLGVILSRPAVWNRMLYPVAVGVVFAAALLTTADAAVPVMRWGVVGLVVMLLLVSFLGRAYLPAQPSAVARAVRSGGYLLVAVIATPLLIPLSHKGKSELTAIAILTAVFAGCLIAFVAVTATAGVRTLVTGAAAGVAAAALWTVAVVVSAPIPQDPLLAVALTAVAMGVAAVVVVRRSEGAGSAAAAAALAGTVAALGVVAIVMVLSAFGPASLIPALAPHALTPADRLADSRIELVDPYVWMLLVAFFTSVGSLPSILGRRTESDPAVAV